MKSPSMPSPPDPVKTAQAQTATNVETATNQQQLNMVDQSTPYGNSTYTQTGSWADGTPKFANQVSLSPNEQRNQNQQWEFDGLTNQLGIDQTKKLAGHLSKPVQMGNEATESRLMELGSKRLNPMLSQRTAALENKLYNQGVMPGTEAYDRAMRADTEGSNDAFNQLLLAGRGQANQELLTERNQPINEITALMSGGQVTQPNFQQTPQTQVAGTDIAGLTMDAYKYGPMAQFQAKNARNMAINKGMFDLGSAAVGGWASGGKKA